MEPATDPYLEKDSKAICQKDPCKPTFTQICTTAGASASLSLVAKAFNSGQLSMANLPSISEIKPAINNLYNTRTYLLITLINTLILTCIGMVVFAFFFIKKCIKRAEKITLEECMLFLQLAFLAIFIFMIISHAHLLLFFR